MNSKSFDEQIDDYKDSIFAIIGFAHLVRYDNDTKKIREEIRVFQGRRMQTSLSNRISQNKTVTPDFCIQDPNGKGIVGEVKKSFPANQDFWMKDFRQLMKYDDDLLNWSTKSGRIDDHDIVLLIHRSRSRGVIRYFKERLGNGISFTKSFVVIEFVRSQQVQEFFAFRKEHGDLGYCAELDRRLEDGVDIPFRKVIFGRFGYEKVKLYDTKPPLPYLLHLIWESVVMRRAFERERERFENLRKNSKLPVDITVSDIVEELHENYSFKQLSPDDKLHQPKIPLKSWIKESVDLLVRFKLAEWKDGIRGECTIYFKKFSDVLGKFKELCEEFELSVESPKNQLELFDDNKE